MCADERVPREPRLEDFEPPEAHDDESIEEREVREIGAEILRSYLSHVALLPTPRRTHRPRHRIIPATADGAADARSPFSDTDSDLADHDSDFDFEHAISIRIAHLPPAPTVDPDEQPEDQVVGPEYWSEERPGVIPSIADGEAVARILSAEGENLVNDDGEFEFTQARAIRIPLAPPPPRLIHIIRNENGRGFRIGRGPLPSTPTPPQHEPPAPPNAIELQVQALTPQEAYPEEPVPPPPPTPYLGPMGGTRYVSRYNGRDWDITALPPLPLPTAPDQPIQNDRNRDSITIPPRPPHTAPNQPIPNDRRNANRSSSRPGPARPQVIDPPPRYCFFGHHWVHQNLGAHGPLRLCNICLRHRENTTELPFARRRVPILRHMYHVPSVDLEPIAENDAGIPDDAAARQARGTDLLQRVENGRTAAIHENNRPTSPEALEAAADELIAGADALLADLREHADSIERILER